MGADVATQLIDVLPVYDVAPAFFFTPLFQYWLSEVRWFVCPVVFEATRTSLLLAHETPFDVV